MGERLQPGPEPGLGAAHPLADRSYFPVAPGEHRDDPVRLTQVLGAQHNPVIPVIGAHVPIVPYASDIAGISLRGLPPKAPPSATRSPCWCRCRPPTDRKSTRLNSSHMS